MNFNQFFANAADDWLLDDESQRNFVVVIMGGLLAINEEEDLEEDDDEEDNNNSELTKQPSANPDDTQVDMGSYFKGGKEFDQRNSVARSSPSVSDMEASNISNAAANPAKATGKRKFEAQGSTPRTKSSKPTIGVPAATRKSIGKTVAKATAVMEEDSQLKPLHLMMQLLLHQSMQQQQQLELQQLQQQQQQQQQLELQQKHQQDLLQYALQQQEYQRQVNANNNKLLMHAMSLMMSSGRRRERRGGGK